MDNENKNDDRVINNILLRSLPFFLSYFSDKTELCAAYFYRYIVLNDIEAFRLFNSIYYNELNKLEQRKVMEKYNYWKKIEIKNKTKRLIKNK